MSAMICMKFVPCWSAADSKRMARSAAGAMTRGAALESKINNVDYLPRYLAASIAMMRPELLAQEACEPGARLTS